jgi:hypothetical protein
MIHDGKNFTIDFGLYLQKSYDEWCNNKIRDLKKFTIAFGLYLQNNYTTAVNKN